MATYSSHRLIMGKMEICNFFLSQWRYLGFFFAEMLIEWSSTFHMTCPNQCIWLSGWQKGSIFAKMFKNLLLRDHIEDEAETWHTCLGHCPLQKLCFLFRSDKNFGCYDNLPFP